MNSPKINANKGMKWIVILAIMAYAAIVEGGVTPPSTPAGNMTHDCLASILRLSVCNSNARLMNYSGQKRPSPVRLKSGNRLHEAASIIWLGV